MARNTTPVATILDRLDDPTLDLHESYWLTYGDDLLDNVIGIDVIRSQSWILGAEPLPRGIYDGDAICVGSGPSMEQYLPMLRDIQDRVLIVAAHSAIRKLMSHGITPHLITPKERLPDEDKIPVKLPPEVVYAGLPLVPIAPSRCERHYLVGDVGKVSRWLGINRDDIAVSTTSGTLSAYVAAAVCTGKVWLVGHDLAQGHFTGYAHAEERQEGCILCADGVERPSNRVYRAAVHELAGAAQALRLVQTAPYGARIDGAEHGPLAPRLAGRPVLRPRPIIPCSAPETVLARLPAVWDRAIRQIAVAKTSADLSVLALFGEQDKELGQVIGQATYLSVSILRRTLPLTDEQAFVMLRDGLEHAFKSLEGWVHGHH